MNKKKRIYISIIIFILASFCSFGLIYFYNSIYNSTNHIPDAFSEVDTSGWEKYKDSESNFSFSYPNGLSLKTNYTEQTKTLHIEIKVLGAVSFQGSFAAIDVTDLSVFDDTYGDVNGGFEDSFKAAKGDETTLLTRDGDINIKYSEESVSESNGYAYTATFYRYFFTHKGYYYTFYMANVVPDALMSPQDFKTLVSSINFK